MCAKSETPCRRLHLIRSSVQHPPFAVVIWQQGKPKPTASESGESLKYSYALTFCSSRCIGIPVLWMALAGPARQCRVRIVSNRAQLRLTPVLKTSTLACNDAKHKAADQIYLRAHVVRTQGTATTPGMYFYKQAH